MIEKDLLIWSQYENSILYAKRFVDCHDEAEDLVSDAFVKILVKCRSNNPPAFGDNPTYYIRKTIKNLAIDLKRRKDLITKMDTNLINYHNEPPLLVERLNEVLDKCTPSVIKFIDTKLDGLSTKEAATMLNINESAYKTKWHRIKKTLKEQIISE